MYPHWIIITVFSLFSFCNGNYTLIPQEATILTNLHQLGWLDTQATCTPNTCTGASLQDVSCCVGVNKTYRVVGLRLDLHGQSASTLATILQSLSLDYLLLNNSIQVNTTQLAEVIPNLYRLDMLNSTTTQEGVTELVARDIVLNMSNTILGPNIYAYRTLQQTQITLNGINMYGPIPEAFCTSYNIMNITNSFLTSIPSCMIRPENPYSPALYFRDSPIRCSPFNTTITQEVVRGWKFNVTLYLPAPVRCEEHPRAQRCMGRGTCFNREQFSTLEQQGITILPCPASSNASLPILEPSYHCVCQGLWTGPICDICNETLNRRVYTGPDTYATLAEAQDEIAAANTWDCVRDYTRLPPQCAPGLCHPSASCTEYDGHCTCNTGYTGDGTTFCSTGLTLRLNLTFVSTTSTASTTAPTTVPAVVHELLENTPWNSTFLSTLQQQVSACALIQSEVSTSSTSSTYFLQCNILSPDTTHPLDMQVTADELLAALTAVYTQWQSQAASSNKPRTVFTSPDAQFMLVPPSTTATPQPLAGADKNWSALDSLPLGALIGLGLCGAVLLGGIYYYAHKTYPHANNALLVTLPMQLLDIILDWSVMRHLLTTSTSTDTTMYTIGAVYACTLVIPLAINATILFWIFRAESNTNQSFRAWMTDSAHRSSVGIALVCGLSSTQFATLLSSRLFDKASLHSPLSQQATDRLQFGGLTTIVLEDVTQTILQLTITTSGSGSNTLGFVLLLNILVLLHGLTKRALDCCTLHAKRSRQSQAAYMATSQPKTTIQVVSP